MAIRAFLDEVLKSFSAPTLTDSEWAMADVDQLSEAYTPETYLFLRAILEIRDLVSDSVRALSQVYLEEGVDIPEPPQDPKASNIFFGGQI